MARGLIVSTDGEPVSVEVEDYTKLQEIVGGLFDVVPTPVGDIWVHDEGIYLCEPNPYISLLAAYFNDQTPLNHPFLFGTAVVTGKPDEEGNATDLEDETELLFRMIIDRLHKPHLTVFVELEVSAAKAFASQFK